MVKREASANGRPTSWRPTGRPDAKPHGTVRAGSPVTLATMPCRSIGERSTPSPPPRKSTTMCSSLTEGSGSVNSPSGACIRANAAVRHGSGPPARSPETRADGRREPRAGGAPRRPKAGRGPAGTTDRPRPTESHNGRHPEDPFDDDTTTLQARAVRHPAEPRSAPHVGDGGGAARATGSTRPAHRRGATDGRSRQLARDRAAGRQLGIDGRKARAGADRLG